MDKWTDNNSNRFQLDRVAFYGRTLPEYLKMFGIDDAYYLRRFNRILDCPSGASSFIAETNNKYGINAVGCDPLFDKDSRILQKQGEEDIEYVVKRVSLAPDLYNWDFYSSVEELRNYRKLALKQFLSDYALGRERKRYVKGELAFMVMTISCLCWKQRSHWCLLMIPIMYYCRELNPNESE